jgi:presenilin 1
VLDDLGQEITGIMAPVSICMAITVLLVKALNPEGTADTTTVAIATLAYQEQVWLHHKSHNQLSKKD